MPDQLGRLSPAEIQYVLAYLSRMPGGVPVCPVSRHQSWGVAEYVGQAVVYPVNAARWLPETAYPFVMIICTGCGYTMLFNAVQLGLYPLPRTLPPTTG
jgi:hypothetical protein